MKLGRVETKLHGSLMESLGEQMFEEAPKIAETRRLREIAEKQGLWFCWRCRKEILEDGGDASQMVFPISELWKDLQKKGYYVCKKHNGETER